MPKYKFEIQRHAIQNTVDIEVEAEDMDSAVDAAIMAAYDHEFYDKSSEYEINYSKRLFESLAEITAAVDAGTAVFWKSTAYKVIPHFKDYAITCVVNDYMVGLTNTKGELTENLEDFYTDE